MRMYTCQVIEGSELMLALLPVSPAAKKSWYLRAVDAESFDTWRRALNTTGEETDSSGLSVSQASKSTVL
jgi:hypothetical protein